ncbi:MAG: hypothetical protein NEHIOOID_01038 [Holosporales bacterium]
MILAFSILSQANGAQKTDVYDTSVNGRECIAHTTTCSSCHKVLSERYDFQDGTSTASAFSDCYCSDRLPASAETVRNFESFKQSFYKPEVAAVNLGQFMAADQTSCYRNAIQGFPPFDIAEQITELANKGQ